MQVTPEVPTNPQSSAFWPDIGVILFLGPIWVPIVYIPLMIIESIYIPNGLINNLGLPLIFIVPALGAISIATEPGNQIAEKLISVPLYYVIALVVIGFWGLLVFNCWCQLLDYLGWHHCVGH